MFTTTWLCQRGIDYRVSSREHELWLCCPFCTDRGQSPDGEFKMGLNLATGQAHCFRCEWKSRGEKTFTLLATQFGIPFTGVLPGEIPQIKPRAKIPDFELPEEYTPLFGKPSRKENDDEFAREARFYLQRRGVTETQIAQHEIGYACSGRYSYRILFPVKNQRNKLVGLVGRDWTGQQEPKYLNSANMHKGLYGEEILEDVSDNHPLIITEGIFDVLAVGRAGFVALSLLGKTITEESQEVLSRFSLICLFLDWDEDGIQAGIKTAARLCRTDRDLYLARPQPGFKDAAEMSTEDLTQAITQAELFQPGATPAKIKMEFLLEKEYGVSSTSRR